MCISLAHIHVAICPGLISEIVFYFFCCLFWGFDGASPFENLFGANPHHVRATNGNHQPITHHVRHESFTTPSVQAPFLIVLESPLIRSSAQAFVQPTHLWEVYLCLVAARTEGLSVKNGLSVTRRLILITVFGLSTVFDGVASWRWHLLITNKINNFCR